MADAIPSIKQCMNDVKSGYYTTTTMGRINEGGIVQSQVDPLTGNIVSVAVNPAVDLGKSKVIKEMEAAALTGDAEEGKADLLYNAGKSPEEIEATNVLKRTVKQKEEEKKKSPAAAADPPAEEKKPAEGAEGEKKEEKKEGDKKEGEKKEEKKDGDKKDGDKKQGEAKAETTTP